MVRILREKAEMGDPKAMSDLGATYFQGIELPRDHSTAFGWFERSATAGYTLAFVNLATCYREGLGCPKNERKALECYKVVAEVETDAMELLGEIYMNGDCGVAKDPREGAYWFRRGAEAGSLECSYRWGVCCATGTGAERDFGNAAEAFRFAAERGHAGAALDLGHCLMNGLGIIGGAKPSMAVEAYAQAAEAGISEACYHLGCAWLNGNGTKGGASAGKAARWFQKAAEAGHPAASAELAALLHVGAPPFQPPRGVAKDVKAAKAWYEKAVELGVTDAAAALGRMHRDGVGGDETTRDLDEAARWFRVSAAGGDDASAQALIDLEKERVLRDRRRRILAEHDAAWATFVSEAEIASKVADDDIALMAAAAPVPEGETLSSLVAAKKGLETAERWNPVSFAERYGKAFVMGELEKVLARVRVALERFPQGKKVLADEKARKPKEKAQRKPAAAKKPPQPDKSKPAAPERSAVGPVNPATRETIVSPARVRPKRDAEPAPKPESRKPSVADAKRAQPRRGQTASLSPARQRAPARDGVAVESPPRGSVLHPRPWGSGLTPASSPPRSSPVKERAQPQPRSLGAAKENESDQNVKPKTLRPSEGGSGRSKPKVDAVKLMPASPYASTMTRKAKRELGTKRP